MHLEILSNGLGGQSMLLMAWACAGIIPATVSITADTGWENDCLWNTGERTSAREFYERVVVPMGNKAGIECRFVRSVDKDKKEFPALGEYMKQLRKEGQIPLGVPMFGSEGGRQIQTCTDKWKIRAVRQEARRMGAKTMRNAQGIHHGEAWRRVKGSNIGIVDGWTTYQTELKRNGVATPIKWVTHYYPLVDKSIDREGCQRELAARDLQHLVSSECDGCPHKDFARWQRTSPETLKELSAIEASFNGKYFFTSKRVPLLLAIELMREDEAKKSERTKKIDAQETDFGCNDICGI